jgi:beta-galactosidase
MKNRLRFIAIIVLTLATVNHVTGQTTTKFVANFDSDWKFFPGDTTNAYETNFNDNAWRLLDLPHDWSIEGTVSENARPVDQEGTIRLVLAGIGNIFQ